MSEVSAGMDLEMIKPNPVQDDAEWRSTIDIHAMLDLVDTLPDYGRKVDFFSIACCRRLESLLVEPGSRQALEALERTALDSAGEQMFESVLDLASCGWRAFKDASTVLGRARYYAAYAVAEAVRGVPGGASDACARAVTTVKRVATQGESAEALVPCERDPEEKHIQRELLRCIVGNPFRPVEFAPAWRTDTALALAAGIYAERAFDRLPILADALEEAGCDHPDILAHCRGPGPHARGCWVVDGVLGKV